MKYILIVKMNNSEPVAHFCRFLMCSILSFSSRNKVRQQPGKSVPAKSIRTGHYNYSRRDEGGCWVGHEWDQSYWHPSSYATVLAALAKRRGVWKIVQRDCTQWVWGMYRNSYGVGELQPYLKKRYHLNLLSDFVCSQRIVLSLVCSRCKYLNFTKFTASFVLGATFCTQKNRPRRGTYLLLWTMLNVLLHNARHFLCTWWQHDSYCLT